MTTLQDVCAQLMKPAKDLAEWNFPLSQILEDYYTLLSEPCDLNFSEAALVLQNSANVFVRRVEYLYQETAALSKSMQEHEDENGIERSGKISRKTRKTMVDFKNFDLVDFSQEVLKRNNEKPTKEGKEIKLISPRFPQLENISRHKSSLDIIDVQGEIIGKKYDFRCNQQLTLSRMLIEEVTPQDFTDEDHSEGQRESIENNNVDSEEHQNIELTSYDHFDACSEDEETSRDAGILSPTVDSGYGSMISSSNPNTPSSRAADFSQTLNSTLPESEDRLTSPIVDPLNESESNPNDSGIEQATPERDTNDFSDNVEMCETSSEKNSESSTEHCSDPANVESVLNTPEKIDNDSVAEKIPRTRDSTETDAGYTSGDPEDLTGISSKKIRTSTDVEENIWKPIPVETVVPDKIPRLRREFKLPCNIALLKTVPKIRRKRTSCDTVKKRCSKKFLSAEKMKEAKNAEEIKKMFDERLKLQLEINTKNYVTIFAENMDLLGFRSRTRNSLSLSDNQENENTEKSTQKRKRNISLSESVSSSPLSPDFLDNSLHVDEDIDIPDELGSKSLELSHQERIEQKMLALKKEFEVKNQLEEETTKWYEAVEALKAAENRPSFDVDEYEKKIIESLKAKNQDQVEFHEIVEQEEPGNVARLFVASLHLANTYNVELNVVNKEDNSELNLKLLDTDFSHKT